MRLDERMFGSGDEYGASIEAAGSEPFEVELGSLVAALSAGTEDELELELALRALVESGGLRIAVGGDAALVPY